MSKKSHPVFTEKTECQDCYKCVRGCPVKSIRIVDSHAAVVDDDCTACGHCITICPAKAKHWRNDTDEVKKWLAAGEKIAVSIAPSFVAAFPAVSFPKLAFALKQLGFSVISETAHGADTVSAATAKELARNSSPLMLSTACPAAMRYVLRYRPDLSKFLPSIPSPLIVHTVKLREKLKDIERIVFMGPCVAKMVEADSEVSHISAALTFADLKHWLKDAGIDILSVANEEMDFFGAPSKGVLYPIDGGMIRGIRSVHGLSEVNCMTISGLENIRAALHELDPEKLNGRLFLELLACEGGCVNGPAILSTENRLVRSLAVCKREEADKAAVSDTSVVRIEDNWVGAKNPQRKCSFSPVDMAIALHRIGKLRPEDELNCGGCGYSDCRSLAAALLEKHAEPAMCVSYMRKLAQKKANALIQSLPLGVVMVDDKLNVIECNEQFARLCGKDVEEIYKTSGLEGAMLSRLVPFDYLFSGVLSTGERIVGRELFYDGRVFRITVFPVEQKRIAGAVLADITEPAVAREAVLERTQAVIDKQINTVQRIAYLLGENAAETETLLRSLSSAFSIKKGE